MGGARKDAIRHLWVYNKYLTVPRSELKKTGGRIDLKRSTDDKQNIRISNLALRTANHGNRFAKKDNMRAELGMILPFSIT